MANERERERKKDEKFSETWLFAPPVSRFTFQQKSPKSVKIERKVEFRRQFAVSTK